MLVAFFMNVIKRNALPFGVTFRRIDTERVRTGVKNGMSDVPLQTVEILSAERAPAE